MIPLDDRGLLLGDGLFETILARRGELILFEAHLARMAAGCAALGLPPPDVATARRDCESVCTDIERAAVRLTLTAGSGGRGLDRPASPTPRLVATAAPAPRSDTPARLATVQVRRNEGSPASRLKTLAYIDSVLARREAQALGADEALMLNNRGEVACGAAANVFWQREERLFTPALDCGVLEGVMRGALIAEARSKGVEVVEVRESREAFETAGAVFLTNSLIGVRPVSWCDGRAAAPSRLGEQLAAWIADVA